MQNFLDDFSAAASTHVPAMIFIHPVFAQTEPSGYDVASCRFLSPGECGMAVKIENNVS